MEPEIIIKQTHFFDSTGDTPVPVPEVLILGNREGLLELAARLRQLAERHPDPALAKCDPDDHQHCPVRTEWDKPFNHTLSDELEIRLGVLTAQNRDAVLRKYGISPESRQAGSLVERYRNQADRAEREVSGMQPLD